MKRKVNPYRVGNIGPINQSNRIEVLRSSSRRMKSRDQTSTAPLSTDHVTPAES